jgi:uncharacterized membrane protein YeaQ/YmgE (transglycosylase-associated protein family)
MEITLGSIIGMIVVGLIVGAVARLLMPGADALSIPMTIVVGILGSFVGGLVGIYVFHRQAGFFLSLLGAMLVLFVMRRVRV